ncbi:MAG TPA: DUF362 domain-containing protein [Bryobacteraceae bacterium]|nr:DUF362 domain-containing protein [Bryobacteraceae bacterium]
MDLKRRQLLTGALAAAGFATLREQSQAAPLPLGIPGPYRGRVVAVEHPASIISGKYQREPVREMIRKGLMELTGAPSATDAWRVFFQKGDVVGIKVNPVGQPYVISAAEVFQELVAGLGECGIPHKDVVAYDRYRRQFMSGGFEKWLPEGVRWTYATDDGARTSPGVGLLQLDMDGYDRDMYMEMALVARSGNPADSHHRRSYVAKFLSKEVNKVINLGVLKHHQSAGVTIALKNLSHGMVNNVARSHVSSSANSCGMFIPTVVDLPVFRQKIVLNVIDGILGAYHGGPGSKVGKYMWEHKTMYFATDPVAVDRVGWNVLDDKRAAVGMQPLALAPRDNDSTFVRMQPEHVELAALLGLGEADEDKIDLKRVKLG